MNTTKLLRDLQTCRNVFDGGLLVFADVLKGIGATLTDSKLVLDVQGSSKTFILYIYPQKAKVIFIISSVNVINIRIVL